MSRMDTKKKPGKRLAAKGQNGCSYCPVQHGNRPVQRESGMGEGVTRCTPHLLRGLNF